MSRQGSRHAPEHLGDNNAGVFGCAWQQGWGLRIKKERSARTYQKTVWNAPSVHHPL